MEANKILGSDLLDLVFENRNKDYGAYALRKTYSNRIVRALFITASVAVLALAGSWLSNNLENVNVEKVNMNEITLEEIKPQEEIVPPPVVPPPVDPPKIQMEQFTPPKIVKDEEVQEPPPTQDDLEDVKIDVKDQEGIKDDGIVEPTVIDEGKGVIEEKKEEHQGPFEKVEIQAEFPGGDPAWIKYLKKRLNGNVPVENGAPAGVYKVEVQFVVSKEGRVSDVRALTNHGYGMEAEAVKVIKGGPDWKPGIQNGRPVDAYRKQPITFQVDNGE